MQPVVTYRPMVAADLDSVLDLLSTTFCQEPLESLADISYQDFWTMAEFEIKPILAQGFCHVAENAAGTIVAALIAHDVCTEPCAESSPCTDKYRPISAMINPLYQQHIASQAQQQGQLLYIFIVCVNSNYQRQGIVKTLIARCQRQAQQQGYRKITVITTGPGSLNAFLQSGYQTVGQTLYTDFEYQGLQPFSILKQLGGASVLTWQSAEAVIA